MYANLILVLTMQAPLRSIIIPVVKSRLRRSHLRRQDVLEYKPPFRLIRYGGAAAFKVISFAERMCMPGSGGFDDLRRERGISD